MFPDMLHCQKDLSFSKKSGVESFLQVFDEMSLLEKIKNW